MSRRGAGSARGKRTAFEFIETPALARPVLAAAQELLGQGMTSAEVCSLFTQAAATLAQQRDGLERQEWLDLCEELLGRDEIEGSGVLTAPGGSA